MEEKTEEKKEERTEEKMEGVFIDSRYNDGKLKKKICHDGVEEWTEESLLEHLAYREHSKVRVGIIAPDMEEYRRLSELSKKIDVIFEKKNYRRRGI